MKVLDSNVPDAIPWNDLVHRCVAGDETAWDRLVGFAWPMVARWMRRACQDADLAEDLTQTVFLRLMENQGRRLRAFDPERGTSFPAYLRAVASNLHVDWIRSREGLDRSRWLDLDAARELTGSAPSPDVSRDVTWVLDCLDRLKPREAQALRLLLCGWSYEEIAQDLGIGAGGTGALIFRAREKLRELLQGRPQPLPDRDPDLRKSSRISPLPG